MAAADHVSDADTEADAFMETQTRTGTNDHPTGNLWPSAQTVSEPIDHRGVDPVDVPVAAGVPGKEKVATIG